MDATDRGTVGNRNGNRESGNRGHRFGRCARRNEHNLPLVLTRWKCDMWPGLG
jgi:hypothetical protein